MAIAQPPSIAPPLTYEAYIGEFASQPTTMRPYEIIDGVRIFMNSPLLLHQRVVFLLALLLREYERTSGSGIVILSPFDVVIRRDPKLQTRQPDLLFITNERLERAGGLYSEGPLEVAPDLVIEVLSPSETRSSLFAKIEDFQRIGVQEAWIVSPQGETVQVLTLQPNIIGAGIYGQGQSVESVIFPSLSLPVASIFAI